MIKNRASNSPQAQPVSSIPFNCFIHSNEHLPLYTWKTILANKYRLLKVIPRGCSLRPPHLLCWGKGRAMALETCPFVPHIWSLFTAGLLPTSMQPQKGLASSSLTLCAPLVLQSCSATFPQWKISSAAIPLHPSHSPLTNQGAFDFSEICSVHADVHGHSRWCSWQNRKHLLTYTPFLTCILQKTKPFFQYPMSKQLKHSNISWPGKETSFYLTEIRQNTHMYVTVLMSTYR